MVAAMVLIRRAGALVTLLGFILANCANKDTATKSIAPIPGDGGADGAGHSGNSSAGSSLVSAGKSASGGAGGGATGDGGKLGKAGQSSGGQVSVAGGGGQANVAGNTAGGNGGQISEAGSGNSAGSGCGVAGKPTGNLKIKVADGNGTMRDVELLVPASYDNKVPRAVSIAYHGAGGVVANARAYGLQDAAGASDAAIFVFPQGIGYKSFGVGWDDTCGGYDMPLFDNMLAYLKGNYCIDTARVFVSGFSWGCDHVTALACCRGNKIRGVAAASCSDEFGDTANASTYQNLACPVSSGAGIRFTHETLGDPGYPSPMFATTLSLYRSFNKCGDTATATNPAPCRSFNGCSQPVIDCPYDGLGHQTPANFGKDTWAFFSSL